MRHFPQPIQSGANTVRRDPARRFGFGCGCSGGTSDATLPAQLQLSKLKPWRSASHRAVPLPPWQAVRVLPALPELQVLNALQELLGRPALWKLQASV
mmetsp:Transcript_130883/g.230634  ORF Transcript_130883/g.230634 Transcript_130883/m.230634 type:complete len:98 (-) Transcript_130883:3470-3763(-)